MAAPESQSEPFDEAEKAAVCALTGLAGIGLQSLSLLRERFGSLKAAAAQGGKALAEVPGLRADGVESLRQAPDLEARGAWLLAKAKELGADVFLRGGPGYPASLESFASAPAVLYVLGKLGDRPKVAVVGSRRADDYGLSQTARIAEKLTRAGVDVVSGGAEGVDKQAHEKVLSLGGRTIAVVGTGLLKPYPADHWKLYDQIAVKGAVVSQFALDSGGPRHQFPQRNRTIAGLSDAVIITRGREGSGALSTCEAARDIGRPVFALPGRVDERDAFAPNSLLSTGEARALVTGDEVLRLLGMANVAPVASGAPAVKPVVPPSAEKLYGVLGPSPRYVDELAQEAGLAPNEALVELLKLELAGLCTARPGKYFARR